VNAGSPDTNYNIYETKVDKLASRIHELETNFKLFISTTIDIHKASYNLNKVFWNQKNILKMLCNLFIIELI
jgi:hypothetical protein